MRKGILAAGNWIIDHVKIITAWPKQGMLVDIIEEAIGTGGAPYNVLIDLAKLKVDLPLYAAGVIGCDQDGQYIIDDLKRYGIANNYMVMTEEKSTAYTEVMTEKDSGQRTFFHYRGANDLLDYKHFVSIETEAKIFHLGYLLLLAKLDAPDPEYGVVGARVLDLMKQKGYKTSIDLVSKESEQIKKIVLPCLRYTDYLIINEIEAGASTGLIIRQTEDKINLENLQKAAQLLLDNGVNELVVIHFPEGGYAKSKKGEELFVPSFVVKKEEIKSTVGAGDAFCAGMLFGLHEGLSLEKTLKLANACARFNLTSSTCTDGAVPLEQIKEYIQSAPLRETLSL